MKRDDIDLAVSALICERIRALRDHYPKADDALENWGRYSRDRDDRPAWIVSPSWPHQVDSSKWDIEDEGGYATRIEYAHPPERGDRAEPEPYDEGRARDLCDRMHRPGGLPDYLLDVVKVVYYKRPAREDQMHQFCSPPCPPDAFRERLETCLQFVARFA